MWEIRELQVTTLKYKDSRLIEVIKSKIVSKINIFMWNASHENIVQYVVL